MKVRIRTLLGLAVAAVLAVLVTAGPAAAHATLESTTPAQDDVVATAPRVVTATFDESVGVSQDSLRVFSPTGARVDDGDTVHGSSGETIQVALRSGLSRGTYTVAWHVISADSHPVQGAFTFSIGAPSTTTVDTATINAPGSQVVGITYGVARWLAFASYAVLIGAAMFLIVCWPAGARRAGPLRLIGGGWAVLLVASAAVLLLQGVYGGGLGLGQVFSGQVIRGTLDSRLGHALVARGGLLVLAALFLVVLVRRLDGASVRLRAVMAGCWLVLTAGIAATWVSADHASAGTQVPLALASGILHLTAMAVWVGGLTLLVAVLLRDRYADVARRAVPRFSTIAAWCVAVMVVTGTYQGWRDVGSINALFDTDYGRLAVMKIIGLSILILLGYLARLRIAAGLATAPDRPVTAWTRVLDLAAGRSMAAGADTTGTEIRRPVRTGARLSDAFGESAPPRRPGVRVARAGGIGGPPPDADAGARRAVRALRWSVSIEVGIAAAVLAVTALLVNSATGRETYSQITNVTESFSTGTTTGSINMYVSPAQLGLSQLHIFLVDAKDLAYDPAEVDAEITLPSQHIGPLPITVLNDGPGHYISKPFEISFVGTWQLHVTIRSDAFDEANLYVPVPIS